jgi:hypothetical protein
MKMMPLAGAVALVSFPTLAIAQLGSGIVFDPTQSAHAAQQILQANSLYTTAVETTRNVISAYNLAQRMANLPQALYTSYVNMGRQQWAALQGPANTYGNAQPWITAAGSGYGASAANDAASFTRATRIDGYAALTPEGQRAIASQGATVDLSDSVNATNLQTLGMIRASSAQRENDISSLEAATHSADLAQHTEMATLQRINQALLIDLRTQQETNQMLQAQGLQMMIGQKVQQDNLKLLFQSGNSYQQSFPSVTPQSSTAGLQWGLHY